MRFRLHVLFPNPRPWSWLCNGIAEDMIATTTSLEMTHNLIADWGYKGIGSKVSTYSVLWYFRRAMNHGRGRWINRACPGEESGAGRYRPPNLRMRKLRGRLAPAPKTLNQPSSPELATNADFTAHPRPLWDCIRLHLYWPLVAFSIAECVTNDMAIYNIEYKTRASSKHVMRKWLSWEALIARGTRHLVRDTASVECGAITSQSIE